MRLRQTGERADQHILIFLLRQPADIEESGCRQRQIETAARLGAVMRRDRRIEPVFDQNHRTPVTRRIAGELGPGRRAVYDIGGRESERAGKLVR